METVNYSKPKLWMHAVVAGLLILFGFWLMTRIGDGEISTRFFRLFSSNFGRYMLAPLIIVISAAHLWRVFATLSGPGRALLFGSDGVTVTTLWKTAHIPWEQLGFMEIRSYGNWLARSHQLVIHHARGGVLGSRKVRLELGATELRREEYQDWLNRLVSLKSRIMQGERPMFAAAPTDAAARAAPLPQPESGGFDPDAALARYMARKASGDTAVPPVRPVFGRKGI